MEGSYLNLSSRGIVVEVRSGWLKRVREMVEDSFAKVMLRASGKSAAILNCWVSWLKERGREVEEASERTCPNPKFKARAQLGRASAWGRGRTRSGSLLLLCSQAKL